MRMSRADLVKPIISKIDEDMSEEALQFYNIFYKDQVKLIASGYMRGDTMCSVGWTFGSCNKGAGEFIAYKEYTKQYTKNDIKLFNIFRERYHSKANFCVWPAELNTWRGSCYKDGRNQRDYPDIFLYLIQMWYCAPEMLSEKVYNMFYKHKNYFATYGKGEFGWVKFVEVNYFKALCNIDYDVKDMFAEPEEYEKDACRAVVGSYHSYGFSKSRPQYKLDSINFMKNSIHMWDTRANQLETAAINNINIVK